MNKDIKNELSKEGISLRRIYIITKFKKYLFPSQLELLNNVIKARNLKKIEEGMCNIITQKR